MHHLTLRQLRIFEAAARHLHFGRAAREMHLTQPAVSLQLKQLEEHVGLPLFEQMGRRMHLTHAGEELLRHSRIVLRQLREAEEAINALKGTGGGELACFRRRSIPHGNLVSGTHQSLSDGGTHFSGAGDADPHSNPLGRAGRSGRLTRAMPPRQTL
jgi:hypothetical protein